MPAAVTALIAVGAFAAQAPPSVEAPPPEKTISLIDFYLKGGYTMHVILACSVLAVAIIFERVINLRKGKIISTPFIEEILNLRRRG